MAADPPGVYATFTGIPGRGARLWAAVLSAGPGAVLSYQTAAELHGLADKPTNPIHVTVPRERHVLAAEGVSLHRSGRAVEAMRAALVSAADQGGGDGARPYSDREDLR